MLELHGLGSLGCGSHGLVAILGEGDSSLHEEGDGVGSVVVECQTVLNTRFLDLLRGFAQFIPGLGHCDAGLIHHFLVTKDEATHGHVERNSVGLAVGLTVCKA